MTSYDLFIVLVKLLSYIVLFSSCSLLLRIATLAFSANACFKRPNLRVCLQRGGSTSKAVCPGGWSSRFDEAKVDRYINQQERTTPHKKRSKKSHIFDIGSCPLLFQITPFLARARPDSTVPVSCYPPARARTPPLMLARCAEIKGGVLARAGECWKVHFQIRPFEAGIRLIWGAHTYHGYLHGTPEWSQHAILV